jgi:hypothetical protein
MKRAERLHGAVDVLASEAHALQPRLVLEEALLLLAKATNRLLEFGCPSDHVDQYAELDI